MAGSLWGNISATLYFIYFQLAGLAAAHILLKKESRPVRLAVGSATGSLLLHLLPVLWAFAFDFTVTAHMCRAATLIPVFLMYGKYRAEKEDKGLWNVSEIKYHCGFIILAAALFVVWCCLLDSHIIPVAPDGSVHTGQCTYGDMNMHLGFISSIAQQQTFPPYYSIFPGTKLAYPFMNAAISSSIHVFGASLRWAYILPMLAAFVQVGSMIYLLAYTVLGHRRKAIISYVLFFFNGGLGFVYFTGLVKDCGLTLSDIFTGFYTTPTNLVDYNIRWANVIADILLPQRASLFGYAMAFTAVWLLYRAVWQAEKRYFVYAAVFAGALPLIHTHSFLAIGLVSAAWLLLVLYRDRFPRGKWKGAQWFILFTAAMCLIQFLALRNVLDSVHFFVIGIVGIAVCVVYGIWLLSFYVKRNGYKELLSGWGVYLAIVLVMALPQLILWTFGQVAEGGFLRGHFNWGNLGDFYIKFYIMNIGAPLLFIVYAIVKGGRKRAEMIVPAAVIWFVSELILFTPNTYDNNKLLYVAYMLLCIAAADSAVELFEKHRGRLYACPLAVVAAVLCTLSGVLTLGRELVSDYQLYSAEHIELTEYIENNTERNDTFLTNTRHNNEIPSLTGRNIVCGSDTFLYFHGIHTGERKEELRLMFEAPDENRHLYEKYSVDYILVSAYERYDYNIDRELYKDIFTEVFNKGGVILYRYSQK